MQKTVASIVFISIVFFALFCNASTMLSNNLYENNLIILMSDSTITISDSIFILDSIPKQVVDEASKQKKKKSIASVLAFPFPFGFMGAHRVLLGTKPWVPIVYVATFGGCFGLIPLIDFLVITFDKDIGQYENNPHIFMWIK